MIARLRELGCDVKPYRRHKPKPMPNCPPGWFAIAHGLHGKWRLYDGAPFSIAEAREFAERGLGTMAQKRVDGAFDLLFRATHPTIPREDPWPTT
jgi:hypothetical protein